MEEKTLGLDINYLLGQIKPQYLALILLIAFIISTGISIAILYHLNKYREHSPATILAEILYVAGLICLFVVAFIFLVLYS